MPATAPAAGGLVFGYVAGCATARVCGERRRDKRCSAADECRSQVRSGSRWNGVCRVCGERRRDKRCSAGGRMPFASSQRLAHERHLPMASAARRCGPPGALHSPMRRTAPHRAIRRRASVAPSPRRGRRAEPAAGVARRRPPDVRPSRCAGAERRECA
ncbi:hypothetical protein BURPS1710A_1721 [Burkholderia pseudomallei 1710a]|uniref:Uncharacterized protein n=1 Tax=Burkholderia pseudomallei 1710a TaxID=320371 RepID=A0A0E1W249_BURPE|nr:hypothetical protein BURPS1710A_1721 [Burkholderia pseudomallei 1710a]